MIFAWDAINCDHIAKHAVTPDEAQEVVSKARSPYPRQIGDDKLVVWGQTSAGRYLQVIFVLKSPQELTYESLSMEDWLEVETGHVTRVVRVIHAMELTVEMKKRFRKQRK